LSVVAFDGAVPIEKAEAAAIGTISDSRFRYRIEYPLLIEPVLEALKTVRDPEIPLNLVDLGLIYELIVKQGGIVFVEMTLTTPACPVAQSMPGEVETAIRGVPGVDDVRVKLVWTPPWGPERMSEEARLELGML